ncbi:MAG: efflux RND transporter periplasmic adaptor subunit [Janthinobacterium lividum]
MHNIRTAPYRTWSFRRSYLLTLLALVPLVVGCKKQAPEAAAAVTDPNEVQITQAIASSLKFGTPEERTVTGTLQVTARVETDGSRVARVGSPVAGRILRLLVFEGQTVRAGTTLAMLHSTNLSDTQFSLVRAVSQQELAEAASHRAEQLVEADVIGRAELERRRAELLQAGMEAASYRTQLRGLGMGDGQIQQLIKTRRLSADYPIVSPRGGTVLKREITEGQVVQPSDPAFTIADLSSVLISANVPEEEAGTLRRGLEVNVRVPALPQARISGKLSYVAPTVDPLTRTVQVRIDVPNRDGQLKPDELATMTFSGHGERKLTVPNTAVVREDNKDHVFVEMAPQHYVLREVALGEEENDRRTVLTGVRADEHIVLDGAFHLNNQRKQNAIKGGE